MIDLTNGRKEPTLIDFISSIDNCAAELDSRQSWKIRYPLSTILFLVFVCQLAGIKTWKEIKNLIEMDEPLFTNYVDLSEGCPSHAYFLTQIQTIKHC